MRTNLPLFPAAPCAVFFVLAIATWVPPACAGENSPLSPLLEVQIVGREVLAIDSENGGQRSERLERGEAVLYTRSQGRVGLVVTDRRMLAISSGSGSFQVARYRKGEGPPSDVQIGDRVALAMMQSRAVGFDGSSHNLVESTIGPREIVLDTAVGPNVAMVVTDRRALGLSADRGGFFDVRLRVGEQFQSLSAYANHATLQTSQRLLIFRGPDATWEERRLPIN